MTAFVVLGLAALAIKLGQCAAIRLVDVLATAIAAWYHWRSERLVAGIVALRSSGLATDMIPARSTSRSHRRLIARHLRLSIAMTAHYSLFPASSRRGYAIAGALTAKAV